MTTTTTTRPVSEKQIAFVTRLLAEKDTTGTAYEGWTPDWSKATTATTSVVITFLMSLPRAAVSAAAPAAATPEGVHVFEGVTYKVVQAKNGSGNLYAKALQQDTEGDWHFNYAAGAIRRLSSETLMTSEDAARFGHLYGMCVNCARVLTDETSIAHGYGPVCAANNGWDYSKVAAPAPATCCDGTGWTGEERVRCTDHYVPSDLPSL